MLTGFGTPTFERGIQSLMEVHALFNRHIPESKLDEISIVDKCSEEFLGIHLINRYLTSRREAPYAPHIPFDPSIDPSGYLTNLVKSNYFHDKQNVVKYYNRALDSKGATR
jgi:hypothetical protein